MPSGLPRTHSFHFSTCGEIAGRTRLHLGVFAYTLGSPALGGSHAHEGDDPQLEAKRQQLFERIKKMDELMLTVFKNHIGLEQFMSEFLEASGKNPEELTFYDKAEACEELKPPEVEASIWKIVYAANELRNKIAHTFDQAKMKAKMDALRAAYLAALTALQAKTAEKLDDTRVASGAMELCGAYLVVATERVRAGQK